jgi:CRISPR-associated protein Csd1
MFLERLSAYAMRAYASNNQTPPAMYQRKYVRYMVVLDGSGTFLAVVDCASTAHPQGVSMLVPSLKRSVNIRPLLFADTAAYVLAYAPDAHGPRATQRVHKQHRQFVELIEQCVAACDEPSASARQALQAIVHFYQTADLSSLRLPAPVDPTARITFEINGLFPINFPSVQAFWATRATACDRTQTLPCQVCGESKPPAKRLLLPIFGIPGGQTTGMALLSANEQAFESYGLTASLVAPTCEACGQRCCSALNDLLKQRDTHYTTASLSYVFWSKDASPFPVTALLSECRPDEVRAFLSAPWRGEASALAIETSAFYAAVLSARGPRVVLRDWMETTLGQVQDHLEQYFAWQQIVDMEGTARWFPFWQLIDATVRRGSQEEAPPYVGQALFRSALHGGSLPLSVLFQVLRRIAAEGDIQPAQAALVKLVLLSQHDISWVAVGTTADERNNMMIQLEKTCQASAYLCGRLLAVLEAIQYAAYGDSITTTIVKRYYGAASSAPASVFGRLLRGTQPHLAILARDKPGAFYRLDLQLQEILEGFSGGEFPRTLSHPSRTIRVRLLPSTSRGSPGEKRSQSTESSEQERSVGRVT